MVDVLFQISQNGTSNWEDIPIPSEYSVSWEDLDDDSFRSRLTGNLVRRRISRSWVKLSMNYYFVTDSQLNFIARRINTNQLFYIRCKAPAFGNMGTDNDWVQFRAYCSNYSADMLPLQSGWSLSFNIIQSHKGTFNG